MSQKLYLHIGLHKTGTSAIQNVCIANQDRLLAAGFLFPSAGFERLPTRDPTATPGHRGLIKFLKRPSRTRGRREAQELLREMEGAPDKDLIISTEVLSAPRNAEAVAGIDWFRDRGFDVKLIVYVRRQDRQLDSLYRERLKSDGPLGWETRPIRDFWKEDGMAWLDYRTRLVPWVERVGAGNAIVRSYDDAQAHGGVVSDFLAGIGIEEGLLDMSEAGKMHNASIPAGSADFFRAYNALDAARSIPKAGVISAVSESRLFNESRGSLVAPQLWAELKETYGQLNEDLRLEWVSGPSSLLSFEAGEPAAAEARQAISHHDSALLLGALTSAMAVVTEAQHSGTGAVFSPSDPNSFGTITTCREKPEQVREFVNYHLNLGAETMVLYFDDPRDLAMRLFQDDERVVCIPCDQSHWQRLLGRPPSSLAEAQVANIEDGVRILRERRAAWICSIDADELLYPFARIAGILSRVKADVDIVLAKPMEAIQHDGMKKGLEFRSSWFREFTELESAGQRRISERRMPALREFGDAGCLGHREGKTLFRTTADVESHGVHLPRNKRKYLEMVIAPDIALLHFDALSWEAWERKWLARAAGTVVHTRMSGHRQKQHDYILGVIREKGRAGLRRVFEAWHEYDAEAVRELQEAGLVRRIDIPAAMFTGPIQMNARAIDSGFRGDVSVKPNESTRRT